MIIGFYRSRGKLTDTRRTTDRAVRSLLVDVHHENRLKEIPRSLSCIQQQREMCTAVQLIHGVEGCCFDTLKVEVSPNQFQVAMVLGRCFEQCQRSRSSADYVVLAGFERVNRHRAS